MKKHGQNRIWRSLFSSALLFLSLLFFSCRNEEPPPPVDSPDGESVSLEVSLEVLGTRSGTPWNDVTVGRGGYINRLYLMAFDSEDNPIDCEVFLPDTKYTADRDTKLVEITDPTLLIDQRMRCIVPLSSRTFKIAFWAQKNDVHDISQFPYVKLNYSATNNDDSRDAFCAVFDKREVTDITKVQRIVLKRPFAQLNLGAMLEDIRYSKDDLGIEIEQTDIEVSGVYDIYHVLSGWARCSDASLTDTGKKVVFSQSYIFGANGPDEYLWYDFNDNGTYETPDADDSRKDNDGLWKYEQSRWLAMSYFLPAEHTDLSSTVDLKFNLRGRQTIKDETKEYNSTLELLNVPVRRNYQTNLVGWIISARPQFVIHLSPTVSGNDRLDPEGDEKVLNF